GARERIPPYGARKNFLSQGAKQSVPGKRDRFINPALRIAAFLQQRRICHHGSIMLLGALALRPHSFATGQRRV
ncbi:MAG: hypothetical protein ACK5TQ_11100, partial [Acetobacteraceae bacterium]